MRRLLLLCLSLPACTSPWPPMRPCKGCGRAPGKANIVACFNQPSPTQGADRSGSYYYTRYKTPIMLAMPNGKSD
jgi:hypothetical protein